MTEESGYELNAMTPRSWLGLSRRIRWTIRGEKLPMASWTTTIVIFRRESRWPTRRWIRSLGGIADEDHRRIDRDRRTGIDCLQPVDSVRIVPSVHGWRRASRAEGRQAPALGRGDRRRQTRVGRGDH